MAYDWSGTVGRIIDGVSSFSADCLNPIIGALDTRTLWLKTQLNTLTNSNCGLTYTDSGFSAEVVSMGKGAILAWDGDKYVLASAEYDSAVREDGSLVPSHKSYVIGVLISDIDPDGFGTILSYGWSSDAELISIVTHGHGLMEDEPATGAYYLSSDGVAVPGNASDFQLPVYCFTYTGTNKLVFNPKVPEFCDHSHSRFVLNKDAWQSVSHSALPIEVSAVLPADSTCYKYPATGELAGILLGAHSDRATLFSDGTKVADNRWSFDKNNIYVAFDVTTTSEVILYAISPLIGSTPLLHTFTVEGGGAFISSENNSGDVRLTVSDKVTEQPERTGYAISSIDNTVGIQTLPVVHEVVAGAGMSITPAQDALGGVVPGSYVFSSSSVCRNQMEMNVCNLDGVLFGLDDNKVSYRFPANIRSSMFGTFRVPHYDASVQYTGAITLAVQGSGSSLPAAEVTITPISMPLVDSPTPVRAAVHIDTNSVSATNRDSYYALQAEIPAGIITSDALLQCRITIDSPDRALTVVGVSIQILNG